MVSTELPSCGENDRGVLFLFFVAQERAKMAGIVGMREV